jgi:asparagine synthase (glutamine-hydrolysing)
MTNTTNAGSPSTAKRDRLGVRRIFVHAESGTRSRDLHSLLSLVPAARRCGLDWLGVKSAWSFGDAPDRTCLAAVRAVPPARAPQGSRGCHGLHPHPRWRTALGESLPVAAAGALAGARSPVVALGGGIDAPLVVLAARRAGIAIDHAIHLSIPGTRYDESLAAREMAAELSLSLHEIRITVDELAAELPRAVRLAETPFYNMHPVSRVIVARVARSRGHDALVTGDGADQAARGATEPADYVPIVAAMTRGAGLSFAAPFAEEEVVELVVASTDPEKQSLRELARVWGLPAAIADRPKIPSAAPPLPRHAFPSAAMLARLVDLAPEGETLVWTNDDRRNVGIASLAAFVNVFEITGG